MPSTLLDARKYKLRKPDVVPFHLSIEMDIWKCNQPCFTVCEGDGGGYHITIGDTKCGYATILGEYNRECFIKEVTSMIKRVETVRWRVRTGKF